MELLPLVVESSIEMPWSPQEHPPPVTARVLQTPRPCDATWLALACDSKCRCHNAMSTTNSCDPARLLVPTTPNQFLVLPGLIFEGLVRFARLRFFYDNLDRVLLRDGLLKASASRTFPHEDYRLLLHRLQKRACEVIMFCSVRVLQCQILEKSAQDLGKTE